jgi:hypothetical protein
MNNSISSIVMSKTSWGSKQAKEAFGIKLPKTNMKSSDVLELLALDKASSISDNVYVYVSELLHQIRIQTPTFTKEVTERCLKKVWNEALTAGIKGEDKRILKSIIVTVQKQTVYMTGRNQVVQAICSTVVDMV